ncbi:GOS-28 SNARE- RELATED [Salix purpurea]|uniref:GOS-28 SNARE- RELATED n=1 Tax=Salix purpurea TaxID=77065 RepID=A0A9Q0YWW9_SALPP|nr:GOS-28 SNARE- RELATED [Salix purpurea]
MNLYRKLASSKGSTKVDSAENDLESGIDRLLKQLQQVDSQMQAWVLSGGSEMVSHTLTRHQEILQDLTQEFHRLRSGMRAKQEHALLLEDFRELDRTRLDLEDGVDSADQALLREHVSISRNTGQMDNVISQAQATLGSLVLQRSAFGGINSKLSNVSSRLPTVNQILSAIKRRKSMDTIILSLVASRNHHLVSFSNNCAFKTPIEFDDHLLGGGGGGGGEVDVFYVISSRNINHQGIQNSSALYGVPYPHILTRDENILMVQPETLQMGDNNEDPWLAPDKLYHVLFCLSLTLLFSKLASLARYPFLKRHSIRVGAILSLFAGATKEAADQIGLFPSAGASSKDAVADIIGVLIAVAALSMFKSKNSNGSDSGSGQTRRVLPL